MIDRVLDELGNGFDVQFQHDPGLVVLNCLGRDRSMHRRRRGSGGPARPDSEITSLLTLWTSQVPSRTRAWSLPKTRSRFRVRATRLRLKRREN